MKSTKRFKMELSDGVLEAMNILMNNGYSAYAVGGCVRDSVLLKRPSDYDLTTSATPDEMLSVFSSLGYRCIETGIKHGTLTVIINGENIEITTYRVDGEYRDNRHPEGVTFTRLLKDDLARRDFTVNAMAYNPVDSLVDEFGGIRDIELRIIRCVGKPCERFSEDGLRILRAIRFSSVLDFEVEAETDLAIHTMKGLLRNISSERIYAEFCKMICGDGALSVLSKYGDVIEVFCELDSSPEEYLKRCRAVSNAPKDLCVRIALFFNTPESVLFNMKKMKSDAHTSQYASRIAKYMHSEIECDRTVLKKLISEVGFELFYSVCDAKASLSDCKTDVDALRALADDIRSSSECVFLKELCINGNDIKKLGFEGKDVGRVLSYLLCEVIEGNIQNTYESLVLAAKEYKL